MTFFGIGIYHAKHEENIGTLWRSAQLFGANYIFTIGAKYKPQSSDTGKAWKSLPLFHFRNEEQFLGLRPREARLIGIEMGGQCSLQRFVHPPQAIYLLGSEAYGIPPALQKKCDYVVEIPDLAFSLNVATTGSLVMYDRKCKNLT